MSTCQNYFSAVTRIVGMIVALWSPSSDTFLSLEFTSGNWDVVLIEKVELSEFYENFPLEARFQVSDAGDGMVTLYNQVSKQYLAIDGNKIISLQEEPYVSSPKALFDAIAFDDDEKIIAFRNRRDCGQISIVDGKPHATRDEDIDWNLSGFVVLPVLQPNQDVALWFPTPGCYVGMEPSSYQLDTYCPKDHVSHLEFWRHNLRFQVVAAQKNNQIALFNDLSNRFLHVEGSTVKGMHDASYFNGSNYRVNGEHANNEKWTIQTFLDGEIALHNDQSDSFLTVTNGRPVVKKGEISSRDLDHRFVVVPHPFIRLPPDYVLEKALGVGQKAKVFLARHFLDGGTYAVKCLKERGILNGQDTWASETSLMARLPLHINVVRYFTATVFQGKLFIVTELIDGQPLLRALPKNPSSFDEMKALMWAYQIVDGLQALHTVPILHRCGGWWLVPCVSTTPTHTCDTLYSKIDMPV